MHAKVRKAIRAAKYQTGGYVDPMGNVAYAEDQNTPSVPSIPVDERVRQYLRGVKEKRNPNMIGGVGLPDSEREYLYPDDTREPSTVERMLASPQGQQLNFLANFIGPGPKAPRPGIRAYHGSPHDFDRFDISKIGTGEGAQAYGHGLYFAESERVAKSYRDALKDGHNVVRDPTGNTLDNATMYGADPNSLALHRLRERGDFDTALKQLRQEADNTRAWRRDASKYDEAIAELERLKAEGYQVQANPGRMYEVRIDADPEDFLDWDKPLSQQSEKVRNALSEAGVRPGFFRRDLPADDLQHAIRQIDKGPHYLAHKAMAGVNGDKSRAVKSLSDMIDYIKRDKPDGYNLRDFEQALDLLQKDKPVRLENTLRDAGIPGIRYFDAGSRAAGEGSRNYVLFRDDIIDIVRKYGMAAAVSMYGADAVTNVMQDGN